MTPAFIPTTPSLLLLLVSALPTTTPTGAPASRPWQDEAESASKTDAPDDPVEADSEERTQEADEDAKTELERLLDLEPAAIADLVPVQAGLTHVRCPVCPADDSADAWSWSLREPEVLSCLECESTYPNDQIPAKVKNAVPELVVEVRPGVFHHYPYHVVEPEDARYPGERIYLHAKRDQLARAALANLAFEAARRFRDQSPEARDERLATAVAVLLLRFAQVYPNYGIHYDQPGRPAFIQPADVRPPYRIGYQSSKWDWSASLNVPIELAAAYDLIRDDPAIERAGRLLDEPRPAESIEDFFRSTAEFLIDHPDPYDERTIQAARGLIVAGQLLGEPRLERLGYQKLDEVVRRGFYHDGLWRSADAPTHRDVVRLLETAYLGLDALRKPEERAAIPPPRPLPARDGVPDTRPVERRSTEEISGLGTALMLPLAWRAERFLSRPRVEPEIRRASFAREPSAPSIPPAGLLGGAGLARLASGRGDDAFAVELRGLGDDDHPHFDRLGVRLWMGGRERLGDLDFETPTSNGWQWSSASHNLVTINGLNQRETLPRTRNPRPGSDLLYFVAEPDLQLVTMADRWAYPTLASRYRHTLALISDSPVRYILSIFEVVGGRRHDQLFHAASRSEAAWKPAAPTEPGPRTLLPAEIPYVPDSPASGGRWFVQAYGAFERIERAEAQGPTYADLIGPDGPQVRLHLLNLGTSELFTAQVPEAGDEPMPRGALVVRRTAESDASLASTFVSLFEPLGAERGLKRVGRLPSEPGTVVLLLETARGLEHLVVNLQPGTEKTLTLADGSELTTDGLLVRVNGRGLTLAGGTFAEVGGRRAALVRLRGEVRGAGQADRIGGHGYFDVDQPLPAGARLAGETLVIQHANGVSRGWTIDHVERAPDGNARVFVVEAPGFRIDPETGVAHYEHFPGARLEGPHHFSICRIARSR